MPARSTRLAAATLSLLILAGCASARPPAAEEPAAEPAASAAESGAEAPAPGPAVSTGASAGPVEQEGPDQPTSVDLTPPEPVEATADLTALGDPCDVVRHEGEDVADVARRRLFRTACAAALWFDGLFGDQRNVAAARRVAGRFESSITESQYWGTKTRVRFNVRMRLPNLEEHAEAFAGRDDEADFVEDRTEGFALRSQFRAIEREDRWVAGLGYRLPGSYRNRADFRIGVHGSRTPEVFAQARYRHNRYLGERALWHFKETGFWTNRQGFGATTGVDYGQVLTPTLLFRWSNVGTFSERTDGLNYRSALVLYKNLERYRAIAWESYLRGETDDEVPLREYGMRMILRMPIRKRDWLFGELVGGYGWVRERTDQVREGSATIGFGIELLFGREDPYGLD